MLLNLFPLFITPFLAALPQSITQNPNRIFAESCERHVTHTQLTRDTPELDSSLADRNRHEISAALTLCGKEKQSFGIKTAKADPNGGGGEGSNRGKLLIGRPSELRDAPG